jgi:hypothetical protein
MVPRMLQLKALPSKSGNPAPTRGYQLPRGITLCLKLHALHCSLQCGDLDAP